MIVSFLENSVIIDILYYLVWLNELGNAFLRLDELVESLQLLCHVVNGVIYYFLNLDKFMVAAEAP